MARWALVSFAIATIASARADGGHDDRVADLGWPGPHSWSELPPAHQRFVMERELITTMPKSGKPRGVVFATHGCLQYVTEFGWKSHSCPECHGSPEMMGIVWKFVRHGYAVVGMGAYRGGDQWRCYETRGPIEDYKEVANMIAVMKHVLREQSWWGLPRFLFGSSSGGVISLMAALRFPVHGVASMLMGMRPEMLEDLQPRNLHSGATWPYPPTFILRSLEDEENVMLKCNLTIEALRKQGVEVRDLHLHSYPLGEDAFALRIPTVTPEGSREIYRRLRALDIIAESGMATWRKCENCWDATYIKVKDALWDMFPHWEDQNYDRNFKEIFWASQGTHDTTAYHTEAIIAFFESAAERLQGATHLASGDGSALSSPEDALEAAKEEGREKKGLGSSSGGPVHVSSLRKRERTQH